MIIYESTCNRKNVLYILLTNKLIIGGHGMAKSFWNRVKDAFKQDTPKSAPIKTNDVNDPTNRQRANAEDVHDFSSVLTLDNIKLQLDLTSQAEVLKYLSRLPQLGNKTEDSEKLYGKFLLREKCSTNLGEGVALPHIQATTISQMTLVVLQLKQPIVWGSGEKVSLVLTLFIPETEANFEHINYLAGLAQLLLQKKSVADLQTAQSVERVYKLFNQ